MNNAFISFNDFQKKTQSNASNLSSNNKPQSQSQLPTPKTDTNTQDTVELQNKIEKAKRQNGLIEKLADKIKGLTGIGFSSKKLDENLEKVKTGEVSKEKLENDIHSYRSSQENTAQATADVASGTASIFAFFGVKQGIEKLVAKQVTVPDRKKMIVDSLEEASKNIKIDKLKNASNFLKNFTEKHLDKRYTAVIAGAGIAMFVGGLVKSNLLKANRIGTKQYKAEIDKEKMSKKEIKQAKKQAKKQKSNANFRNFATGAINGLTTPILSVLGGFGAPIYVGLNSLSRYFIGTKEDSKNKSLKGYIENLKSSAVVNTVSALAIAFPAIKQGKFNKVFEKNIDKVIANLNEAKLEKISEGKTSYQQLKEVLFQNDNINSIMNNDSLSTSEKIQQLSDENIFALKFKQIAVDNRDSLARALKTDCPPTRSLEEAQEIIDKTFKGKYKIESCVGVGTVAETYLVKDGEKQYCIKMLKNGINAEKINADKQKFIDIINGLNDKTPEEKRFLIDNIENIAQGVAQEVDFNNEMKAAKELAKVTTKAKLVKPIEVKDGLYVMEKADGISLSDFGKYANLKWKFTDYNTGKIKDRSIIEAEVKKYQDELDAARKKIADHKAILDTPEAENWYDIWYGYSGKEGLKEYIKTLEKNFDKNNESTIKCLNYSLRDLKDYDKFTQLNKLGISDLTEKESEKMLKAYQDIFVEQFSKVDKEGKIIHGDIHPGNIFIDIDGLKQGKKDFFTLIDTGNTIHQSQESAMRFLNLSNYIKNCDYENIADFVLEGAKLPQGMDNTKARETLVEELKKHFFDNETYLGKVSNDNILSLTDGIMQKYGIIPSDTQGNLMKSKTSAQQSMKEFSENYAKNLFSNSLNDAKDFKEVVIGTTKATGKLAKTSQELPVKQKIQERKNLMTLSPADKIKLQKSKSTPKKNSVEFLTYELKQNKKAVGEKAEESLGDVLDNMLPDNF